MLTLIIGACAILTSCYYGIKLKSRSLIQLFKSVTSLNFILYLGLLLQLLTSKNYSQSKLIIDFILSSGIFICRFYFLFSFFKLVHIYLHTTSLNNFIKPFKVSLYVAFIFYAISWIEPLIWGARNIEATIMIYTDIIVLLAVLGGGVFLYKNGKLNKFKYYQKEIQFLGITFIIPMSLAVLKWVLNNTELMAHTNIERTALYVSVSLFNSMIIIWLLFMKKSKKSIEVFHQETGPDDFVQKYGISKRELEIIKLISEGKTNQDIADALFISIETVKDHNSNIYLKTDVKNRTQLTKLYLDCSSSLNS